MSTRSAEPRTSKLRNSTFARKRRSDSSTMSSSAAAVNAKDRVGARVAAADGHNASGAGARHAPATSTMGAGPAFFVLTGKTARPATSLTPAKARNWLWYAGCTTESISADVHRRSRHGACLTHAPTPPAQQIAVILTMVCVLDRGKSGGFASVSSSGCRCHFRRHFATLSVRVTPHMAPA